MNESEAKRRGQRFRELHASPELLVLPNPWDAGTARMLEGIGFRGLATTSAGLAWTLGRRDGDGAVTADETFKHVSDILAATSLPVSADLENGFGTSPEAVAATIRRAGEVGLSGGSIEDATYDSAKPLFDRGLAVERIHAAVEAARVLPHPFVLTARAENFIRNRPDLDDALWRLKAYEKAGADVLYAPGLPDEAAVRLVCSSLSKPVNHLAGAAWTKFTLAQFREMGVRRVTIGSSFARAALTAFVRASREVFEQGSLSYLDGLITIREVDELVDPRAERSR